MRRLTSRRVELTPAEEIVEEWFNDLLDRGWGVDEAIARMHGAGIAPALRSPRPRVEAVIADEDFITWLTKQVKRGKKVKPT